MEQLLKSLIQVSLGKRDKLVRIPFAQEWAELLQIAKEQAIVGVCFNGISRLYDCGSGLGIREYFASINLCKSDYFEWTSFAVRVQDKNSEINARCVELSERFASDGVEYYILKGPSVAALYGSLACLRQAGDIDVWMPSSQETVMRYAKQLSDVMPDWDYSHVDCHVFDNVEVELHYRPSFLYNVFKNRSLQRYFKDSAARGFDNTFELNSKPVRTVSYEFNCLFILLHLYKHMFNEGIGLRQLMDYYFVLNSRVPDDEDKERFQLEITEFGIKRFASAVMWIMGDWFCLEGEKMLCVADERDGRFLVSEVMCGGNFGQYDKRDRTDFHNYYIGNFIHRLKHLWHLAGHYPREFFWSPLWLIWHWLWKHIIKH